MKSNLVINQNIILRKITNSPQFVSNHTLHSDLHMKTLKDEVNSYYKHFHLRLNSHPNPLITNLATIHISPETLLVALSENGAESY